MVAGTVKSTAIGTPASVLNSRKRKSDGNQPNASDKLHLSDPLLRRLSSAAAVTRSFLQTKDIYLSPSQSLRLESLLSSLPITPPPPTTTWFNRFLTSATQNNDPRWYICFRMSKSAFFSLLSVLSPLPPSSLAATLFRLAHNASYNSLLLRFGYDSVSEASRDFFIVCKLINDKLSKVNDPKPDYSPRLLPNCCGVIGFGKFKVKGKLLGYKGSLIVQALVDSNGRFTEISAGWPSTMKPEAIFRQTKLFSVVEGVELFFNGTSVPRYVLGDSCLPLLPWVMTPYKEEDSLESFSCREFNSFVETALHSVEIAFAKVKARWGILDRKWKLETLEFLPFIVTTGCLLHNFLVNSGDDDLVEGYVCESVEMRKEEGDEEEEETGRFEGEAFIRARRIRDAISENLTRVSSIE